MINPRAVATLGIGYGARAIADCGLLPIASGSIAQPRMIAGGGYRRHSGGHRVFWPPTERREMPPDEIQSPPRRARRMREREDVMLL